MRPREGVKSYEHFDYRGKQYEVPVFDVSNPVVLHPRPLHLHPDLGQGVFRCLNTVFNLDEFIYVR